MKHPSMKFPFYNNPPITCANTIVCLLFITAISFSLPMIIFDQHFSSFLVFKPFWSLDLFGSLLDPILNS